MPSTLAPLTRETVGDAELHTLPNGETVVSRDRDHSYWKTATALPDGTSKCSGRLTGISTVVSPYDWRPDNLMRWAARINCQGIAALFAEQVASETLDEMRAGLAWLTSEESITSALEDARLHYTQTRDDAAQRGTNVHKHALQALAEGHAVPDFAAMTDEEAGYARGVMAFWHECEPEPEYAEAIVLDAELGVAGRLDLIATVTYCGLRQRAVVDAKTSGYIPTKHHAQIGGYRYCAQASGMGETDLGLILQVRPDGTYELVPACATPDDFRAAVDVYRRAGRMQRDLTAARKAAA
jgi:hypothetical protein